MTEAQLKSFRAFRSLPFYDADDVRSGALTAADGGPYGRVRTCATLRQVDDCLHAPRLVPLGGLRADDHDPTVPGQGSPAVVAVFGELR